MTTEPSWLSGSNAAVLTTENWALTWWFCRWPASAGGGCPPKTRQQQQWPMPSTLCWASHEPWHRTLDPEEFTQESVREQNPLHYLHCATFLVSFLLSSPHRAAPPPASSAPPWCAALGCPGWRALWAPAAAAPSAAWQLAAPAAPGSASPAWTEWPGRRSIQMLDRTRFPEISLAC